MNSSARALRAASRISSVLGLGLAVADVVGHGIVEQESILRHDADLGAQRGQLQIAHVLAVDADGARGHIVEARHQVRQRGFARAARAHQRHHLAGLHFQVDAVADGIRWARSDSGS